MAGTAMLKSNCEHGFVDLQLNCKETSEDVDYDIRVLRATLKAGAGGL
jgi:hypothetical protein